MSSGDRRSNLGFVQAIPDLLVRITSTGEIIDARPGGDVDFHVSPETFIGRPLSEIMPPGVANPAMIAIGAALQDNRVHSFEYHLDTPAGRSFFEARVVASRDNEVVAIIRDISEIHKNNATSSLQSAVAENMAEGAAMVRMDNDTLVWANPRLEEMLGYKTGELQGFRFGDLIAEFANYAQELRPSLISYLSRAGRWLGEAPLRRENDKSLWCELTVSSFDHPEYGQVMVALASDISERKANRVIEQTLGQVGQLLLDNQESVPNLLKSLALAVSEITGDCCVISMVNTDSDKLEPVAQHSLDSECDPVLHQLVRESEASNHARILQLVKAGEATTVINDITADQYRALVPETHSEWLDRKGVSGLVTTPIKMLGTPIGSIATIRHDPNHPYRNQDVNLLEAIAQRAGPAIENARLHDELAEGAELLSNTQTGIVRLGSDLTVLSWNPGAETITGYTAAETIGKHLSFVSGSVDDYGTMQERFEEMTRTQEAVSYEIERVRRDGERYWISVNLAPLFGPRNAIVGLVVSFTDITAAHDAQVELEAMARSDSLTGLANRMALQEALGRSLARYRRYGVRGALLYLDLDHFKQVNDQFGHQTGDDLLREVGDRLAKEGRETDTVARLGGDEFGILVDPVDGGFSHALEVAQRLVESVARPYEISGRTLHVNASCGIAYFPEDGRDPDALLKHADEAMYAAKSRGGGGVERYRHPANQQPSGDRADPAALLRSGIRNREFALHFQPIVQLRDEKLVGVEGLARWEHPDGSIDYPPSFLPLAESSGLIIPLGYQLFDDACAAAAQLECVKGREYHSGDAAGTGCPTVSVNISRRQFAADDLAVRLQHGLNEHKLGPGRITLEISEETAFDDVDRAVEITQALRDMHIQVALDDFGTGYSSLNALSKLAIDSLKIDRSFVSKLDDLDATERERHEAIITAATSLGHFMGLTVVAEGVETQSQHDFLRDTGCDRAQGFFYAMALPAPMGLSTR